MKSLLDLTLSRRMNFQTKMAILSFYHHNTSHFAEKVCLILEYTQLLSLTIILSYESSDPEVWDSSPSIISMIKVLCPGYFLHFDENDLLFWFSIILIILIVKYIFLGYTTFKVYRGQKLGRFLTKLWSWVFLFQGRVLFLFETSFCINIIKAANEGYIDSRVITYTIIIFSILFILIEGIISLAQRIQYSYYLPTKQFLASKSNIVELITLSQKCILIIFDLCLLSPSVLSDFIIAIMGIILSVIRDLYYFKTRPPYRLKTFYFQSFLHVLVTSLNLSFLLRTIINSFNGNNFHVDFALIVWLVILPLAMTLCLTYMNKSILTLLYYPLINMSPTILIHKISIIKHIRKIRKESAPNTTKNNWFFFLFGSINVNIDTILSSTQSQQIPPGKYKYDIDHKMQTNKRFVSYLEMIAAKFPRNQLTKLYLAYYYGSRLKLYGVALKLMKDLEQSCSSRITFNVALLKYEIQNSMKLGDEENKKALDLVKFLQDTHIVENLKQKIIVQAELQLKLYRESRAKTPDLDKILSYSQAIDAQKRIVFKEISSMSQVIPNWYLEPLLICAHYFLQMNFSQSDYARYHEILSKKYAKRDSTPMNYRLCQENLYDNNNALLILATQKEHLGTIEYCSKSVEKLFGWSINDLKGKNINKILPQILSSCYLDRIRTSLETDEKSLFKDVFQSFVQTENGFLMPADFGFGFHPFISDGLYLDLILRPVKTSTQYVIVDKNGMIQSTSESLTNRLGLTLNTKSSSLLQTNIAALSQELVQMNKACDVIACIGYQDKRKIQGSLECDEQIDLIGKQKSSRLLPISKVMEAQGSFLSLINSGSSTSMNLDQAKTLYEASNLRGQRVTLHSPNGRKGYENEAYPYYCKVKVKFYPLTYLKIFSFQELRSATKNHSRVSHLGNKTPNFTSDKQIGFEKKKLSLSDSIHMGSTNDAHNRVPEFRTSSRKETDVTYLNKPSTQLDHLHIELPSRGELSSSRQMIQPDSLLLPTSKETGLRGPSINSFGGNCHSRGSDEDQIGKGSSPHARSIEENMNVKTVDIERKRQPSIESQGSKDHEQQRIASAYYNALNIRYYSKSYKIFLVAFYLILLAIFIDKLIVQILATNGFQKLSQRKDILGTAESINDYLAKVHRNIRFIINFNKGYLLEKDFLASNISKEILYKQNNEDLKTISAANYGLIKASEFLESDDHAKIFAKKVLVFPSYFGEPQEPPYMLNSFQAIIEIVDSGFKGLEILKTSAVIDPPDLKFILRNALNNFLINSEATTDMFKDLSEKNTESSLQFITANIIGIQLSFAFLILASLILVTKEYQNLTQHLLAYIHLNKDDVNQVTTGVTAFKQKLENGASFEDGGQADLTEVPHKTTKAHVKVNTNSRDTQNPNVNSILRRYVFHVLRIVIMLMVLSGIFVGGYFQKRQAYDFIMSRITQIYFSRRITSKINLAVTTCLDLLSENNTTLIYNEPTAIQLEKQMQTISLMTSKISATFKNAGSLADQVVETILYNDGCQFLTQPIAIERCIIGRRGRNQVSFVDYINEIDLTLHYIRDRFYQSNRTTQELAEILTGGFGPLIRPNRVISELGKTMVNTLSLDFEENIFSFIREKDIIDTSMEIATVIFGILAWFNVFKKVWESNNDFRNVLKTLPRQVIMSNYVLKSYLLKTSNNTLDFIRNEV